MKSGGYVYIIKFLNYYKIGYTKYPKDRFGEYTRLPEKPILVLAEKVQYPTDVERCIHSKYKHKRTNGEWFRLSLRDVTDVIKIIRTYECPITNRTSLNHVKESVLDGIHPDMYKLRRLLKSTSLVALSFGVTVNTLYAWSNRKLTERRIHNIQCTLSWAEKRFKTDTQRDPDYIFRVLRKMDRNKGILGDSNQKSIALQSVK